MARRMNVVYFRAEIYVIQLLRKKRYESKSKKLKIKEQPGTERRDGEIAEAATR